MKNLLVANFQASGSLHNDRKKKMTRADLDICLHAQIDNSIQMGWKVEDIIVISNFDFEYKCITSVPVLSNASHLTASKSIAMRALFSLNLVNAGTVVWAHDLDLWQNAPFEEPTFKNIGMCYYSRPKVNGGSIFYKMTPTTSSLVNKICDEVSKDANGREEPALDRVLRDNPEATVLNSTYNVGCSGFVIRYEDAEKPVKGLHFHPTNRIAWDTMYRNRNRLTTPGADTMMSDKLVAVLLNYFGDNIRKHTYNSSERGYPGDWQRPNTAKAANA